MKVLITSGGTKIRIDLVRSITNMSRGTFGSQICDSFWKKLDPDKDEIVFFHAKDSRMPGLERILNEEADRDYHMIRYVQYDTFDSYRNQLADLLKKEQFDIIILAAAVSDYGVKETYNGKYRSREEDMVIQLVKLPKVITEVRANNPNAIICGFKLLVNSTDEELHAAMQKQFDENGIDLCVGNDLRDIKNSNHRLTIQHKGETTYSIYTKQELETENVGKRPTQQRHLSDIVVDHCIEVYNKKTND